MAAGWVGPAIAAAGSLLGGAAGDKASRRQMQAQYDFAQHGIRWRVADARAAGLHPLFALGAQLPSYSPVSGGYGMAEGLADAGQNIGRAVAATQTAQEKQMNLLLLDKLRSEIGENDARRMLLDAERGKLLQEQNQVSTFPLIEESLIQGSPMQGMTEIKPTETPTNVLGDPSMMAGPAPMWREFTMYDGFKMALPGGKTGDPAEALESVSESYPIMWMVFQENVRRYGPRWGDLFLDRYAGQNINAVRDMLEAVLGGHEEVPLKER